MAAWCLGQLGAAEHLTRHEALLRDEGPVDFYADGQLAGTSVARLAGEALES